MALEPPEPRSGPDDELAAPNDRDTGSIDAILGALYQVISGPKGQPRDWDRFRSLFVPEARLIPVVRRLELADDQLRFLTVEDYITSAIRAFENQAFYESEVKDERKVDRFGGIAQVFSTYETRLDPDQEPIARGINSIQLFWNGKRWAIVNIFWDAERPDEPEPPNDKP